MNKINSLTSANIVADNIELLKQLFPTIVKEGNIDLNELKALLGENVEEKEEYYRFTWAGKNQARLEANKPTTATLRPNKADSKDWDTTNNIFIEGDNLEVLKLLQKSYANKIKMIYIDPPYNTGKDFVYKDNYADNLGNYLSITGQTNEEGKKTSTNTESDGRYHSNWLNMIYPRLRLARNLLTDDGVIFISIDDHENHNLKKTCDEIFGEENFVANIIWQKKYAPQNDAKWLTDNHDHILLYARSKENWKIYPLPRTDKQNKYYINDDNDGRGIWRTDNILVKSFTENRVFPIINPQTGKEFYPPKGRCWRYSQDTVTSMLSENRLYFGKDGTGAPQVKRYLNEVKDGVTPLTIWLREDVGDNQEGKNELNLLFDIPTFDTPKVVRLIERMLQISSKNDDITLDFFAGSGTTAHAVMRLNAEDGGNRKCISIQLPEHTDEKSEAFKSGYTTIAEITKERIRRAGAKIKIDFKDKEGIDKLDVGFKAFKLDSSNIQAWDGNPDNLEEQLDVFADNIKTDRTEEDILFEILLKYGLDLTVAIDEKTIAAQKVFSVGQGTLFICLSNAISPAVSEGIGTWKQDLNPVICRVIFKDTGFQSDKDKTNAMQILKRFGIEEVNSI